MLKVNHLEQHTHRINGIPTYISGEWKGAQSSHWGQSSKRYYESTIDESNLLQTNKKHYNVDNAPSNSHMKHSFRKQYENYHATAESSNQPNFMKYKLPKRKHNFNFNLNVEKSSGGIKVYPNIYKTNTEPYDLEEYKNRFNPSSYETVNHEFISLRNSLPEINKGKNSFKNGLYSNLYCKNNKPPKKIERDIFEPSYYKDPRINENCFVNKSLPQNNFELIEKSNRYLSNCYENIKVNRQNIEEILPIKYSKRKVYNIEEQRNFIPSVSPGDKTYKNVEFSKDYFKERSIVSNNMNHDLERNNKLNFYNSIKIKSPNLGNLNKESSLERSYGNEKVLNLNKWESEYL